VLSQLDFWSAACSDIVMSDQYDNENDKSLPPLRFWEIVLIFVGLQFTVIVGIIIN